MKQELLDALAHVLRQWSREDFESLPAYTAGEWSRRSLEAMLKDIEVLAQRRVNKGATMPHLFGLSTLELGDEIESDFHHLKAQEWACEPHEAKERIEAALSLVHEFFVNRRKS